MPTVLNVEAQVRDQTRFAALHGVTADCAGPVFRARIKSFAAQELSTEFIDEAGLLRKFLLEEEGGQERADQFDFSGVRTQLEELLRKPLSEAELTEEDEILAHQFSLEFAGGLWATVISSLHRSHQQRGLVLPSDLLPLAVTSEWPPVLLRVAEDTAHFELTSVELYDVLTQTLRKLPATELAFEDTLYLPRGLKMDCLELHRYLSDAAEHNQVYSSMIKADAANLDKQRYFGH